MRKLLVFLLVLVLALSLMGCGKSKPATEVDQLISDIGEVTLESEDAIIAAEDYYDTLTEGQRDEVENYKTLVDARKAYDELVAEDSSIVGTWRQLWEVGKGENKQLVDTATVEEALGEDLPEAVAVFTDDNKFEMTYDGDNNAELKGTWEYEGTTEDGHYKFTFTTLRGESFQVVKDPENNRLTFEVSGRTYYLGQD